MTLPVAQITALSKLCGATKALAKEAEIRKNEKRRVLALIPLTLDDYIFREWNHSLKGDVLTRSVADFTGWEKDNAKFESQFERLAKALQTGDSGREPAPEPKL